MLENLNQEKDQMEKIEEGKPLIEYMQMKYAWLFREIPPQQIPELSADCQLVIQKDEFFHRLVRLYTEGLIIQDQFDQDHGLRRVFFKDILGSRGSWLKDRSLLSGNNLMAILIIIDDLTKSLRRKKLVIDFPDQKIGELGKKLATYREMDFDLKTAFALEMREVIGEFFSALSVSTLKQDIQ